MRLTYGDVILKEIEDSEYFSDLYHKILLNYSNKIFHPSFINQMSDAEVSDLMEFAYLLSNSNISDKVSLHRNLAQEIIYMISSFNYSSSDLTEKINFYMHTIFKLSSNYVAYRKTKKENVTKYFIADPLSNLYDTYKMQLNKGSEEGIFYFDDQLLALRKMKENQFFSFSAPTSMGKTFIIKSFIREKLLSSEVGNIALILPTKALINEMEEDLINELSDLLSLNNYVVLSSPSQIELFANKNKILVFTPERMLQALNERHITELKFIFIDEAHKIYEKDDRAPIYYKIIDVFNTQMPYSKIYFSSPYAENPEELLKLISNPFLNNRKELSDFQRFNFSPVIQKQFLINEEEGKCHIYNRLTGKFDSINIERKNWIEHVKDQTEKGASIVYCKSKKDVIEYSTEFIKHTDFENDGKDDVINSFIEEIKNEINENYYLIDLLKKRVAFHTGIIPPEIRKTIERLVKENIIRVVFCTSTLLEGVNLPASNIFILSHKKGTSDLSVLEFKNLIGRAGRIKYHLSGNAFLISISDKKSFETYGNFLKQKPKNDKLEPFVKNQKTKIVPSLFDENYKFEKTSNMTYSDLMNFVMFRNLVADSIINDKKDSYIYKAYENDINKYLKEEENNIISFDDEDIADIQYSPEVINNIKDKIVKKEIELPTLNDPIHNPTNSEHIKRKNQEILNRNREEFFTFLIKLHDAFNWGIFESKLDLGNLNKMYYVASIATRWMFGYRLSQIIYGQIDRHKRSGKMWDDQIRKEIPYTNTKSQINNVINLTMNDLESLVKFKLSNYVNKFVSIYQKINNIEMPVHVGDYLDYGTMNDIIIMLQKIGISRELASEIYRKNLYLFDNEGLKIKNLDELEKNKRFSAEIDIIKRNFSFLVLD